MEDEVRSNSIATRRVQTSMGNIADKAEYLCHVCRKALGNDESATMLKRVLCYPRRNRLRVWSFARTLSSLLYSASSDYHNDSVPTLSYNSHDGNLAQDHGIRDAFSDALSYDGSFGCSEMRARLSVL